MNDFVKLQKKIETETPDFSGCQETGFFTSGESCNLHCYKLRNQYTEIDLKFNEANGMLKVKGNFGMFWNGHNLFNPYSDLNNAIQYVSEKVKIDLFPAVVEELDHSAVVNTRLASKVIIQNHLSLAGHFTKQEQYGKYFVKKGQQVVKMYDATKRMNQIYRKPMREKILSSLCIDSTMQHLRFEKKILRPKAYFKREIQVSDLLDNNFISICNNDLMETYKNIVKTSCIQIPKNKKDLSAAILPLIVAKELEAVYGFDFAELLKQRISAIDDDILSKDDKKARKRQIRVNMNKISGKLISKYDISDGLAESLKMA